MTTPALIRAADLKRMATIAKSQGVTVWIEIDGRRVGVSPELPAIQQEKPVEKYKDFDL